MNAPRPGGSGSMIRFSSLRATIAIGVLGVSEPLVAGLVNARAEDMLVAARRDVEALRIALRLPNEIPIIPCVATDRESVSLGGALQFATANISICGIHIARLGKSTPLSPTSLRSRRRSSEAAAP